MEGQTNRLTEAYDLFFCVFVRDEQVDGFLVAKINVVTKQKDEEQFANIFLLLIAVERLVALELRSNIGEFFVDTLDLGFSTFAFDFPKRIIADYLEVRRR